VKHKALPVDLDGYPFHPVMLDGLVDVDVDHVPVAGSVVVRLVEGVVVEITVRQAAIQQRTRRRKETTERKKRTVSRDTPSSVP
jgi:hypothetical protein